MPSRRPGRILTVVAFPVLVCGILPAQPAPPLAAVWKGHTDPVYAVAVAPGGALAATGSFDKTVKLWDVATGKVVATLGGADGHQGQVLAVAFAPDGKVLVSGGSDNAVKLWAVPAGKLLKSLPHPNLVDAVAFDKTGTLLATGGHDGVLRLWDVAKGTAAKEVKAHVAPLPNPIYAVAWSPDGKQVVSASFDRTIKFWDAASGNPVREIKGGSDLLPADPAKPPPADPGHRDQVFTVAFSPDGKLLASGSSDRTVKLWTVADGKLARDFPNPAFKPPGPGQPTASHPGFVHGVRFTPDGAKLVSAGTAPRGRGYLAVWSVADGKLLSGQELAVGPVYSFDLTPKGILLGCGPKDRLQSESDAVLMPLP